MRGLQYWYRGPWQWNETEDEGDYWSPPDGCSVGLDLRSIPEQSQRGGTPGLGIFVGVKPPGEVGRDYDLLGTGDFSDIKESRKLMDMIPSRKKYRVQGDNLKRIIFNLLTEGSDPTGEEFAKPLMPNSKGRIELSLGNSQFKEIYRHGKHSHTNRVLDVIQQDMEAHIENAGNGKLKDSEHHRRVLDAYCDKYRIKGEDNWKQFVKGKHRKEIQGRLKHETTYTDDFNRASLGSDWTAVDGGYGIYSSTEIELTSYYSTFPAMCRYENDLSSDDHYSQVKFTYQASDTAFTGNAVRFSPSAKTCYYSRYRGRDSNSVISKSITGTATVLVLGTSGAGAVVTTRLTVDGSSLDLSVVGGSSVETTTDSSITGNLRCGIATHGSGVSTPSRGDDFECEDLYASSGITYVNLERDIERGLERGLYTKWDG